MKLKLIYAAVFLIALSVRSYYAFIVSPVHTVGDSASWMAPAQSMLENKGYGESKRPPVYPLFVYAAGILFGNNQTGAIILQVILGSFTCLVVFAIGSMVFSFTAGLLSSIIVAFYPYLIFYTGLILVETLFAFLLSLSVLAVLWAKSNGKIYSMLLSGAVLGISALCKPVALVLFPFIFLWIYIYTEKKLLAVRNIAIVLAAAMAVITPWSLRNYFHYNDLILISPGGMDFWLSNNDVSMQLETTADSDMPAPKDWVWYPKERFDEIMKLPQKESSEVFFKEGINWIKNNPAKFTWLIKKRFIHFWRLWPKMATKRDKLIAKLTSGIYFPLALAGAIISLRRKIKLRGNILLVLFLIGFTVAYLPFYCMVRYRNPIDPLVIIFTGYLLSLVVGYYENKIRKAQ